MCKEKWNWAQGLVKRGQSVQRKMKLNTGWQKEVMICKNSSTRGKASRSAPGFTTWIAGAPISARLQYRQYLQYIPQYYNISKILKQWHHICITLLYDTYWTRLHTPFTTFYGPQYCRYSGFTTWPALSNLFYDLYMRWQKCSHTKYAEVLSSRKCYVFHLHSSPNKFVNSMHSLSLLGLAYEGWKENFCPGLQFTFVGLDLCRSAMLQALWPWLLLLPVFTKIRLKYQLLSFPSDESCKSRTGLMKLTWK